MSLCAFCKFSATDGTDHSIARGPMTVIWAKGQEYPDYVHPAGDTVFDLGQAGNPKFYELDVLKYHGSKNRGQLTIDFFGRLYICSLPPAKWMSSPYFTFFS